MVPEKILVCSLKLLGDLIVQTPALAAIRRAFPQAEIVVLCDGRYVSALSTNTDINQVWGIPFSEAKRLSGFKKAFAKLTLFFSWIIKIRRFGFTRTLLMDCNDRACIWTFFSGAKIRAGLQQQSLSFLLNRKLADREGSTDYIEFYLRLAYLIGASSPARRTFFPLPSHAPQIEKLIPHSKKKYIAIHPGASFETKRWGAVNWANLITRVARRYPSLRCVLICGPGESVLCNEIFNELKETAIRKRTVLFSEPPLIETAVVMRHAFAVFCLDSASRHLAAALGVPTISLLTKWILPIWGLYSPQELQFMITSEAARDSYDIQTITVQEVFALFVRHVPKFRKRFAKYS